MRRRTRRGIFVLTAIFASFIAFYASGYADGITDALLKQLHKYTEPRKPITMFTPCALNNVDLLGSNDKLYVSCLTTPVIHKDGPCEILAFNKDGTVSRDNVVCKTMTDDEAFFQCSMGRMTTWQFREPSQFNGDIILGSSCTPNVILYYYGEGDYDLEWNETASNKHYRIHLSELPRG